MVLPFSSLGIVRRSPSSFRHLRRKVIYAVFVRTSRITRLQPIRWQSAMAFAGSARPMLTGFAEGSNMSDDYEVVAADGKVIVIIRPGAAVDKDAITALLVECGVDPSAISFVEPAEIERCGEIVGVPVIFPVDATTSDAPDLEICAGHCAQAGGTVVVVFDQGFPFEGIHPIAADYGTQCGWSPDQLAPRIAPDADCPPLESSGRPVERSRARQVKCGS